MTTKLTDIITDEVSLVGKGANRKKFLLTKSREGTMEELIKELLEELKPIEGEKDLLADLKKGKFSAEETSTVQAAIRLLSGVADKIKKSGIVVKAFETKADSTKTERKDVTEFLKAAKAEERAAIAKELKIDGAKFEEAFGEPKAPEGAILKADGTLNLDSIPKDLRPAMELLFKDRQDTRAELKTANEKIEKAEKDKRRSVYIEKAAEFKDLPNVNVGELAETLMKMEDEDGEKILKQLRANKEVIEKGDFFTERGRHGAGAGGTAIDKVNQLVTGLIKKDDKLDQAGAIQIVMKENPGLYQEYVNETQIRA
jgi:hypothetical protein